MKLDVKNYQNTMHMHTAAGHVYRYEGTIDQPGHIVHGKGITTIKFSPKDKQEKVEVHISVADGSAAPPVFTSLKDLMDHYKLQPSTKP